MQTHQFSSRRRAAILLAVVVSALFAFSACGGGDDEDAPAGTSQIGAKVTVAEGLTIEPGTDAAELVSLWERQAGAVQRGDWEAYRLDCHPGIQDRITADQMRSSWEVTFGIVGEDFNLMISDVRVYGGGAANVTMNVSDGPRKRFFRGITRAHEKSNGRWYNVSVPCEVIGTHVWAVVE